MEENRRVIGPYCTVVQTLYEYTDEALSGNRLLLQPQRSPNAPAERTVAPSLCICWFDTDKSIYQEHCTRRERPAAQESNLIQTLHHHLGPVMPIGSSEPISSRTKKEITD
jgi:hypothetical protein